MPRLTTEEFLFEGEMQAQALFSYMTGRHRFSYTWPYKECRYWVVEVAGHKDQMKEVSRMADLILGNVSASEEVA